MRARPITALIGGLLSLSGVVLATATAKTTKEPEYQLLPSLREQAEIVNAWTAERRAAIPGLLRKHGVDAWIISQREYGEETVFWSLKSATQFSARRRTLYLFLANATGQDDSARDSYEWIDNTPALWDEVNSVLEERQPASIAVNVHPQIAFSSGLHAGELEALRGGLDSLWFSRLVSRPMLGVEYIGTMVSSRLPCYRRMQETAWAIIAEAFSEAVITPGATTTEDVEWWMREKIQALNYTTWFQPSVSIMGGGFSPRRAAATAATTTMARAGDGDGNEDPGSGARRTIHFGDYLHCDFGVTAMGLNTDTQHLAYVLHPGETEEDVPAGLVEGLHRGNRLQDIVRANMEVGETGNAILKVCLDQARNEGIDATVYCHAIGDWGHSAGTVIGMTNLQDRVPVLGDLPLIDNTWYSVELMVRHFVPEANTTLRFPLEEDVFWNPEAGTWDWVQGQQTRFHVIKTPAAGEEVPLRLQGVDEL